MVSVTKRQIAYNKTAKTRTKKDIKAIVIHYTGNYSNGSNALAHYNYWNNANRDSSCDVVIDDHSIYKINDWNKYYCWQIGDGKGKYGYTNSNVIGIEMCVNRDGNFDKTVQNTIDYVRYLHSHGYTKNLVRHYDCSRKLCPIMFVDLNIKGWNKEYTDFRNKVFAATTTIATTPTIPYVNQPNLKWLYNSGLITGKEYKNSHVFDANSIAIILKRLHDKLTDETPETPVSSFYKTQPNLKWLYNSGFITGTEYKNSHVFDANAIAIILKRVYDRLK